MEDEDAEGEEAEEHPLGEKNEEGKLAEEGMRRVVGWREKVTVKGGALKSSLGLKMVSFGFSDTSLGGLGAWSVCIRRTKR